MIMLRIFGRVFLLLILMAPSVRADDVCLGSDEEKTTKATADLLKKAEQSAQPAHLFLAYLSVAEDFCIDRIDKNARARAKANLPKLGRDLAKAAEAKGLLYSNESVRADGKTSAFRYLEAIGDHTEANRVMLKAVQAKPDDLALFKVAWAVDQGRANRRDPKTGDLQPFVSPPAYRQVLQKTASANADQFMKAEEKTAQGLSVNVMVLNKAVVESLLSLRKASDWMQFLPDGDKPAKLRAEQRGDAIMALSDSAFVQGTAKGHYEFSGSAKAKEKIALIEKKSEEASRAMEKSGDKIKSAITQPSAADQQQFDKKKANLEKELGF
jgi:D-Tyr-tRNAtyr deacylase